MERLRLPFTLLIFLGLACNLGTTAPSAPTATPGATSAAPITVEQPIPPVYVTVVGHIENSRAYANCNTYPDRREKLIRFAQTLAPTGAAVNLQIDYEFFFGTARCETDEMRAETEGSTVLDYLATHFGFEIDSHQEGGWEEGQDNYADIRSLGETLTPAISDTVGGLVWDDADQFARLAGGEAGQLYPDFVWSPKVLTLAVSRQHHLGDFSLDDIASGLWIPKGANEDFWAHDPNGHMVYIGPGEHQDWGRKAPYRSTPEFVQAVAQRLEQGTIDRTQMYTVSTAVPESIIFSPERHQELLAMLDQLTPLVETGRTVYVTYSQAVEIWRTEFGARPNIFYLEDVAPPQTK